MDTKTAVDRILEVLAPALTAEMERSVREVQQQQQEQFSKQLDIAICETQAKADRAAGELQQQMEERLRLAEASWAQARAQLEEARAQLEDELQTWRACAEAQQSLAESLSQTDMLRRFLKLAEPFAQSLAIYVMKADGLALWQQHGNAAFADVVSQSTIDPELFFAPIVVRQKTVAAVCAHPPFRSDVLQFLVGALERSIEVFGAKLQNAASRTRAVDESLAVRN